MNADVITFHLGGQNIGVAALAEAMKMNSTLTDLCLHGNNIDDAGCVVLADALKAHRTKSILVSEVRNRRGTALAGALNTGAIHWRLTLREA
jgi:hypothetical protein